MEARRSAYPADEILTVRISEQTMIDRSRVTSLLAPLAFVLGTLTIVVATPQGAGFGNDSIFYWSGAGNLLAGRGYTRVGGAGNLIPITHFPPLYPLLLALGSRLSGFEVADVARGAAAILFGVNLTIIWLMIRRATSSVLAASLASLLVLTAPSLVDRHLWAMSEPLYFALMLLTLWTLASAVIRRSRVWLVLAAGFAGSAYLTRYAGLSLIASSALVLILVGQGPARERFKEAALFVGVALVPGIAWQIRNQLLTGSMSNRVLIWHPPTVDQLRGAGVTLASWLPLEIVPEVVRAGTVGLAALVIVAGLVGMTRSKGRLDHALTLTIFTVAHGVAYVVFLLISLSLFDASTRLNQRILSPVFLLAIVSASVLGWHIYLRFRSRRTEAVLIGSVLVFALIQARLTTALLLESAVEGLGFSATTWRNSETVLAIAELDDELILYSNEALPISYLSGRPAFSIPETVDPVKGGQRDDYLQQMQGMRSRLEAGEAVLVLFQPQALASEFPDLETLTRGLRPAVIATDGVIFMSEDLLDQ